MKYTLLLSIFLITYIHAEVDISTQIAQLKGAKKSEKYMIMNKIKMQISKLNSAQRAKAISQLRRVTSNTVQVSQTVPTLTTHIQDLPQIPVLPAPQIPASLTPQIPVPSVPQIPGPSVPQIPGDIPNQIPPVTIPLSSQHISTGGQ